MEIHVPNNKLRKTLFDASLLRKKYGEQLAKKVELRIATLAALENPGALWPPNTYPERCHELKGALTGTFSIDLVHPFRMLFRLVGDDGFGHRSDEKKRWNNVTAIEIVAIEDTHG